MPGIEPWTGRDRGTRAGLREDMAAAEDLDADDLVEQQRLQRAALRRPRCRCRSRPRARSSSARDASPARRRRRWRPRGRRARRLCRGWRRPPSRSSRRGERSWGWCRRGGRRRGSAAPERSATSSTRRSAASERSSRVGGRGRSHSRPAPPPGTPRQEPAGVPAPRCVEGGPRGRTAHRATGYARGGRARADRGYPITSWERLCRRPSSSPASCPCSSCCPSCFS